MESNYCGFIEIWKTDMQVTQGSIFPIDFLECAIDKPECFITVAIFKIKLKQKTNE